MDKINWSEESKGEGFQVYPEGTYKVTIVGYEQVTAKTGTPQIRWKATILEPTELIGKNITLHTPLTTKSLWKIARLVKACGIDMASLGTMEIGSKAFLHVLDRCLRRTVYWHVSIGADNNGNQRNEIDDFRLDSEQEVIGLQKQEEELPPFLKE